MKAKELARKITTDIDFRIKRDKYDTKYDLHQLLSEFIQTLIGSSVEIIYNSNLENETALIHETISKLIRKMKTLGMDFFMLDSSIFSDSINEMNNDEQLKSEVIEILVNQLYVEKTE